MNTATRWLPQPGSKDWGRGNVLVTTQEGHLVEKSNRFVLEYTLNHGMSEWDAVTLLENLTGIRDDPKASELVNKLHRLPLAIVT